MKISPVCVYVQISRFDAKDIGPSRKSIATWDPPLQGAMYELFLARVSIFDYLDPHMKYCEFLFYDVALPYAYVYDMARTVTRYALCFQLLAWLLYSPSRKQ